MLLSYLKSIKDKLDLKKFYVKKYGNSKIYEKLMKCWGYRNYNDFVFLKSPFQENEIVCDYKIANLVKYLWEKSIVTMGSDQPDSCNLGFISFSPFTMSKKCAKCLILELFGKNNVFCHKQEDNLVGDQLIEKTKNLIRENPGKVLFVITDNINKDEAFHSITFNDNLLKKLHNILEIPFLLNEEIILGY